MSTDEWINVEEEVAIFHNSGSIVSCGFLVPFSGNAEF